MSNLDLFTWVVRCYLVGTIDESRFLDLSRSLGDQFYCTISSDLRSFISLLEVLLSECQK